MLCNAFIICMYPYLYKIYILYTLFKVICYYAILAITKLWLNDTLVILYTLSSSIFTWYVLIVIVGKQARGINFFFFFLIVYYFLYLNKDFVYVFEYMKIQLINNTLQNGLLNIHPVIIYFIYGVSIFFFFNIYKNHKLFVTHELALTRVYDMILISTIGILLGAIWALQELNWGGLWSWDPVEIISLIFLFFFVYYFHNDSSHIIFATLFYLIITANIIYFVIRLGAINSVHSFVSIQKNSFYIKIWLHITVVYVCSKVFYTTGRRYFKVIYYSVNYRIIIKCLWNTIYLYLYLLVIQKIFHFTNLNIFVISESYTYIIFILLLGMLISVKKIKMCKKYRALLLILLMLIIKYNSAIVMVAMLYIINVIYKHNYKILHVFFLILYVVGYLLSTNIYLYTIEQLYRFKCNISINGISEQLANSYNYESSFFLKKQLLFYKCKHCITHVTGFNIISNGFTSFFVFVKNYKIYYLFCEELLLNGIILFWIIVTIIYKLVYTRVVKIWFY